MNKYKFLYEYSDSIGTVFYEAIFPAKSDKQAIKKANNIAEEKIKTGRTGDERYDYNDDVVSRKIKNKKLYKQRVRTRRVVSYPGESLI